jgi:hypothetical protein
MLFRTAVVALAPALALGSPLAAAAATIVPVSQTRSVSAFAQISAPGGLPVSQSFSASNFDPWNQGAFATSFHPEGPGFYVSNSVTQTSSIGDTRLQADITASFDWQGFDGTVNTHSLFDITFDLLTPASYQLGNGQVAFLISPGSHVVTLRDENGVVLAQPASDMYPPLSPDLVGWMSVASGVLAPGRYRLTAEWNNGFASDPGTWNASALLLLTPIPEPGTALLLALGLGALAAGRRQR